MSTTTSACRFYFTHVNSVGEPLLGTMFSRRKQHGIPSCQHKIAQIFPYQVAVTKECRPDSGLRYFYKINSQTGEILLNSMFSGTHKPTSMCSGVFKILEFIITA